MIPVAPPLPHLPSAPADPTADPVDPSTPSLLLECVPHAVKAFLEAVGALGTGVVAVEAHRASLASVVRLVPFSSASGHDEDEDRARCRAIAPCVPWICDLLAAHPGDASVVEPCLILLRRIAWAVEDRAAQLEPVVPLVLPALRAHAGTHTGIAEHGLAYLRMLAYEATCKVRAVGLRWGRLGRERRGHVSRAHARTSTYLLNS